MQIINHVFLTLLSAEMGVQDFLQHSFLMHNWTTSHDQFIIISLDSVTPETPSYRLRLYCNHTTPELRLVLDRPYNIVIRPHDVLELGYKILHRRAYFP